MIKAIIFDYEGVIVDSFTDTFNTYKIIAKKFNLNIPNSQEEFKVIYGYDFHECHKNIGLNPEYEEEAQKIFNQEKLKANPKLFNDIDIVLDDLSKKYNLFVVSSADLEGINNKLQKHNIIKYFKEVFGMKGVNKKTEVIKEVLNKYNINKNESIYIGDRTIDYDIGKEIGLEDENILIVEYGWGYDRTKVKINYKINKPLDIINVIKQIDK